MNGWTLLARETFCYGVRCLALGLGLAATYVDAIQGTMVL